MNQAAFRWGRRAAIDLPVEVAIWRPRRTPIIVPSVSRGLSKKWCRAESITSRSGTQAYAARYRALVERARAIEAEKTLGRCGLAEAVARHLFKLMAYKDEYEVARLYSDGLFLRQVKNDVDGEKSSAARASASADARKDKRTRSKMTFGPWIFPGPACQPGAAARHAVRHIRHTEERRAERALIRDYERMLDEVLEKLRRKTMRLPSDWRPSRKRSAGQAT
ncbi:MAG: DUF6537 domain-containing protein [Xanthobacteraceae bacterium]